MASKNILATEGFGVAFLAVALAGWGLGWWGNSEEWTGYVYPDADNLANHFEVGNFRNNALRAIPGATPGGDYECAHGRERIRSTYARLAARDDGR